VSEKVARQALKVLRTEVYPALPTDVKTLIPMINDALDTAGPNVPNFIVGSIQEVGAGVAFPCVTVQAHGAAEGIVKKYRHLTLVIDIWVGSGEAVNQQARRIASILYEYIYRAFHNTNWSGNSISIQRCYEVERSEILFEPQNKTAHISNSYRVEAISSTWY